MASQNKIRLNIWHPFDPVFQVALILTLSLVGKMCGARTEALPDRDLKTYLPDAVSTKHYMSYKEGNSY